MGSWKRVDFSEWCSIQQTKGINKVIVRMTKVLWQVEMRPLIKAGKSLINPFSLSNVTDIPQRRLPFSSTSKVSHIIRNNFAQHIWGRWQRPENWLDRAIQNLKSSVLHDKWYALNRLVLISQRLCSPKWIWSNASIESQKKKKKLVVQTLQLQLILFNANWMIKRHCVGGILQPLGLWLPCLKNKLEHFNSFGFKIPTNLVRDANHAHPRLIVVQCFLAETQISFLYI